MKPDEQNFSTVHSSPSAPAIEPRTAEDAAAAHRRRAAREDGVTNPSDGRGPLRASDDQSKN
jgi:hypothetical protein